MNVVTEADLRLLPVATVIVGPSFHDEVYKKFGPDSWHGVGSDVPWTENALQARGPFQVLRVGQRALVSGEYHDENTLVKVKKALEDQLVYNEVPSQIAVDLIHSMQNKGILFRERK